MNQLKLFIIDAASPFFSKYKEKIINWSKIPYYNLEKNDQIHKPTYRKIFNSFKKYIKKVSKIGYNAVSIDDLCHLINFNFYHEKTKIKIKSYQKRFRILFKIIKKHDMKVFITSDIMFYNKELIQNVRKNDKKIIKALKIGINKLFIEFKEIDGIIFRIGESDGVDVKSDFKSRLIIKTPGQLNNYITQLLPVFEKNKKLLIMRTWTIGAYQIGDLLWNKKTFLKSFKKIDSTYFVISMKYGEADFFRYLKTNKLFFLTKHQKILELQTRREYEGFGEYPSFIGWYYKNIYNDLQNNTTVIGISVWCQTGGWSRLKNFTYIKNGSLWNELNTYSTIKIFKNNYSVKKTIRKFFKENKGIKKIIKFLKLSNEVIEELLYDPQFAKQEIYFNKLRVPPTLHVFWDNVTVSNAIIAIYDAFVVKKKQSVLKAFKALKKIKKMAKLNYSLDLPYNFDFHYDTYKIIAYFRKLIYFRYNKKDTLDLLNKMIQYYRKKYPYGYQFTIHLKKFKNKFLLKLLLKIIIRKNKSYRIIDRFLFNRFSSKILLLFYKLLRKNFPEFLGNQAMPVSTFLK